LDGLPRIPNLATLVSGSVSQNVTFRILPASDAILSDGLQPIVRISWDATPWSWYAIAWLRISAT